MRLNYAPNPMHEPDPSIPCQVSRTRVRVSLLATVALLLSTGSCGGSNSEQPANDLSNAVSTEFRGRTPHGAVPMEGGPEGGPAAQGMGADGPGPELFRELSPVGPGLQSDGQCLWMQTCG